ARGGRPRAPRGDPRSERARTGTTCRRRTASRWSCPRCRGRPSRRASRGRSDLVEGRVARRNRVAGERADPALRLTEEPQCSELRRRAHVEPVPRPGRNTEQVAGLADDHVHASVETEIEGAAAVDEEADL